MKLNLVKMMNIFIVAIPAIAATIFVVMILPHLAETFFTVVESICFAVVAFVAVFMAVGIPLAIFHTDFLQKQAVKAQTLQLETQNQ